MRTTGEITTVACEDHQIDERYEWVGSLTPEQTPFCRRIDFPTGNQPTGYLHKQGNVLIRSEVVKTPPGPLRPDTPYTATFSEYVPIAGSIIGSWSVNAADQHTCKGKKDTTSFSEYPCSAYPLPDPSDLTTNLATALKRLKALSDTKASADLRKNMASLPMLFAERVATINGAADYVKQLSEIVKALYLRDLKRLRRVITPKQRDALSKRIAGEHLKFIFGVMPLINDVQGLMAFAAEPASTILHGRGRQAEDKVTTTRGYYNAVSTPGSPGYRPRASYITKRDNRLSNRTHLRCTVESQLAGNLRDLGFNPVYTVYDFVPLSFISGWISNFGSYVRTLDPLIGVTFYSGSSTKYWQSIVTQTVVAVPSAGINVNGSGEGFALSRFMERAPLAGIPSASLLWQNNMSVFTTLASISLGVQRSSRSLESVLKAGHKFRLRK